MLPLAGAGMPHSPGGMPGSPGGLGLSAAAAYAIPVATVDLASTWQRPNFDGLMYPYRPPHLTASDVKEHRSLFVMQLEREAVFRVPDDFRLVAVPLFELYDNAQRYGNVVASVPHIVSRFHLHCVDS